MTSIRYFLVALAFIAVPALAQDATSYPSKPIRIIVPFTPGSATDIVARLVGEKLNAAWGQPVIVENRPGAGGTIGIAQTAKADPDGYTLAVVSTGHVVNYVLYKDLPYDTLKDLAGVAPLASLPSVLVVSSALGVKSVKELVAAARARPGELNYGTAGVGSAAHINSEKFNVAAGIQAVHVPLKGTPPILTETMGGRVHFAWVPSVSSMGPLKDGKLIALARQYAGPHRRAARGPDHRRGRFPRRGIQFLGGPSRAGKNTARHRGQAQRADQPRTAVARDERAPGQAWRRADVHECATVRRFHPPGI
jgi:tripartite-type tricarboxylate transporter receptor subunit TctC